MMRPIFFIWLIIFLMSQTSCKSSRRKGSVAKKEFIEQESPDPVVPSNGAALTNQVDLEPIPVKSPAQSIVPVQNTVPVIEVTETSPQDICEALKKDKSFPIETVQAQMEWFCHPGNYNRADESSYRGKGEVHTEEFSPERDRTMHFVSSLKVPGPVERSTLGGSMYCHDYNQFKLLIGEKSLASIQAPEFVKISEDSCEYLQKTSSDFGQNSDMKVRRTYNKIKDLPAFWRVETLVAPLNYSAVRFHSALYLSWKSGVEVRAVYLLKSKYQVDSVFLNNVRSHLRQTVAKAIESSAVMVRDTTPGTVAR